MFHPSRRSLLNMEQTITKEQEPVSKEPDDNVEMKVIKILVESGNPRLIKQGIVRAIRLHDREVKADELTELGAFLLANRRAKFIRKIEEQRNNVG